MTHQDQWTEDLAHSGASASIPGQPEAAAGSRPERGPVRFLCDEIGYPFDNRIERPEVLIAFVAELIAEIDQQHSLADQIKRYTGKEPPQDSLEAIELARAMLTAADPMAAAKIVHRACDTLNPEEAYPTNHTIDMISSCASALRFGLERPCSSRHAAAAASHVWRHVYGVSRFDRHTPAWEREWARSKLQSAIISLLPASQAALADREQPGTDDGEAGGSKQKSLSGEAVLRAEIERLREALNKTAARNRTRARKLRRKRRAPSSQGGEGGA